MAMAALIVVSVTGFSTNSMAAPKNAQKSSKLLSHYLVIQKSLAADKFEGIKQSALQLISAAAKEGHLKTSEKTEIKKAALLVAKAKDIKVAREKFKRLSKPIVKWVAKSKPKGVEIAYCPMAGAKWVQSEGPLRNPYYGSQMLECGEKVSS